MILAELSHK